MESKCVKYERERDSVPEATDEGACREVLYELEFVGVGAAVGLKIEPIESIRLVVWLYGRSQFFEYRADEL